MLHIKKKDNVLILAGKDKGKKGEVRQVLLANGKVLVSGVNVVVKHSRPTQNKPGGIQKKEAPIDISNVAVICTKCDKATRVKIEVLKTGERIRLCKKCNAEII